MTRAAEYRHCAAQGMTQAQAADAMNVSRVAVCRAAKRLSLGFTKGKGGPRPGRASHKLARQTVHMIRSDIARGLSQAETARRHCVNVTTVRNIQRGNWWGWLT
jgi:transcriptional regulator with XRE-family HTH domain